MVPNERRKAILSLLSKRGYMTVEELADEIYVSVPTIRRDLTALADEGSIRRVHGGASHISRDSFEWSFDMRDRVNLTEKRTIGRLAADLVQDGNSIFIDSGTTAHLMVEALDVHLHLHALSNSFPTIEALSKLPHIQVDCPCGQYTASHVGVFGAEAAEYIATRHADYYFATSTGISARSGVNARTLLDMPVKKAMRKYADCMVLLMDHTKMGMENYYQVFDFSEIDILITDSALPDDIAECCAKAGVDVVAG